MATHVVWKPGIQFRGVLQEPVYKVVIWWNQSFPKNMYSLIPNNPPPQISLLPSRNLWNLSSHTLFSIVTSSHRCKCPYLDIELLEFVQVEATTGTVLQKALVPLLELMLIKLCVLHQVLHHLWGQLAVLLAHSEFCARTLRSVIIPPCFILKHQLMESNTMRGWKGHSFRTFSGDIVKKVLNVIHNRYLPLI